MYPNITKNPICIRKKNLSGMKEIYRFMLWSNKTKLDPKGPKQISYNLTKLVNFQKLTKIT